MPYVDKDEVIKLLRACRVYSFKGKLPDNRICHYSDIVQAVMDLPEANVKGSDKK